MTTPILSFAFFKLFANLKKKKKLLMVYFQELIITSEVELK
jgi:hypothetical protein